MSSQLTKISHGESCQHAKWDEMVYGVRFTSVKEELVKAAVSEGLFPEIATIDVTDLTVESEPVE
jgi:hypothetical protein